VGTQIIRGLHNIHPNHRGCVVTIGNFDGMHVGHQTILARLKENAKRLMAPSCVITFEPQPREFFAKDQLNVPRLMRWSEKYYALSQLNIDYLLVIQFNKQFSILSSIDFIKEILVNQLAIKSILVGDDFRFGKGREGDFHFLKKSGEIFDFEVEDTQSIFLNNERVSSTAIRKALINGNHHLAEQLLSHPYTMMGKVVHGDKVGRELGFPTANIFLHRSVSPLQGIYVVRMHGLSNKGLPGVANVGMRPTVNGTRMLLEVYLLNFNENIYGKRVCVEFCKKLRDEERYPTLDLLKIQIAKDVEAAKDFFTESGEL